MRDIAFLVANVGALLVSAPLFWFVREARPASFDPRTLEEIYLRWLMRQPLSRMFLIQAAVKSGIGLLIAGCALMAMPR